MQSTSLALTLYLTKKPHVFFLLNKECDKGHKRSLSSIYKTLGEMGENPDEIK